MHNMWKNAVVTSYKKLLSTNSRRDWGKL